MADEQSTTSEETGSSVYTFTYDDGEIPLLIETDATGKEVGRYYVGTLEQLSEVSSSQTQEVVETDLTVVNTSLPILIVAVFCVFGALCVATLLRSMERR